MDVFSKDEGENGQQIYTDEYKSFFLFQRREDANKSSQVLLLLSWRKH